MSVARSSVERHSPSQLATAICIPGSCSNLRLKTSPMESEATGALNLHYLPTLAQPATNGDYTLMKTGMTFMALFRDPLRAAIIFTPNTVAYTYTGNFANGTTIATTQTIKNQAAGEEIEIAPIFFTGAGSAPHGTHLFVGSDSNSDHNWIWLDSAAGGVKGSTFTVTQSTAAATARLVVYTYTGEVSEVDVLTFAAGTKSYMPDAAAFPRGGYFAFGYIDTAAGPATQNLTAVITGSGDVFAHLAVPQAFAHAAQLTDARINSASFMATPTASMLNISGTITVGSIEGGKQWNNYITSGEITTLPLSYFSEFPFAKGCYSFLRPASDVDFKFERYSYYGTGAANNSLTCMRFKIDKPSRFNVMALVSDNTGAAAPGLEWLGTFAWDVEFHTTDQWFETHPPGVTFDATKAALEAVAMVPNFHENPSHWQKIGSAISYGVGRFASMIPHLTKLVLPFLASLSGPVGSIASVAHSLLPNRPTNRTVAKLVRPKPRVVVKPAKGTTKKISRVARPKPKAKTTVPTLIMTKAQRKEMWDRAV